MVGGILMNKYAYIVDGRVNLVIEEFDNDFPNIPLFERYSEKIIRNLIKCDESIKEGMDYNSETGEFTEHIEPVIEENPEEVIKDVTG